ncbi:phage/plasmid primase, P4 family [Weissella sp. GP1]|uniref:DNA primase family protein n=1 Tax=Weissella confusa TaxID=1583 RepID=UPI00024668A3|nr:phage/plasmid primase, P4 family [Weissella confusa]MBJ7631157.1 hypothetical protein [Weissella confusa]MDY2528505.1 phage/plasmid primase, P4 family [Weissella confusa]CCF29553.1 RepA protein [Weissella confusa LBAE C39-2]
MVELRNVITPEDEQAVQENNNHPIWVNVNEKGQKSLDAVLLGNEIIKQHPLLRTPSLMSGAYFNGMYWEKLVNKEELNTRIAKLANMNLASAGLYTTANSKAVTNWVMNDVFKSRDVFDNSVPWLVPFKNGTYNVKTDTLQPHNKNDYILGGFDYPLDTSGKEPKTINALIKYMVGDGAQFLTEYIGYMFYRSYEPFNKFVVLQGVPGNGKSTLNNCIIKPLMHEKNTSHLSLEELTSSESGARFNIADLLGKYANIFMDLKNVYIASPDQLKNLTGGDAVNARFKGGGEFALVNFATFLFASNELPPLRDDAGVFARALVLPTIAPVVRDNQEEQVKRERLFPKSQIKAELSAFAYYALRQFAKALDNGHLSITEEMKEATKKWRYSDPLSMFLSEETQPWNGGGGITTKRLYDELVNWYRENGLTSVPSKISLNKQLEERGIEKRQVSDGPDDPGKRVWRYIGLDILG